MTPAQKGHWFRNKRSHSHLTLLLISHCGRSLRLQDPFPSPLSPSYLPQVLHAPLSCKLSGPKPSFSSSPPLPLCPGLSPTVSRTLPSYLLWFWLLPWSSLFSPSPSGQALAIKPSLTPFPYLDLTLNPALDLSVSRAQGHKENFTEDWL